MATVTKPILLNETGEKIATAINSIAVAIGKNSGGGSNNAADITIADEGEHYEAANVEEALTEIATSVGDVSSKVDSTESKMASLEDSNKLIEESVSTLETGNASIKASISALETDNTAIKSSIAILEADNASTQESVATLTTKVNNLVSNPSATTTYFYSSGTYVVPDGVTKVYVSGCGGGAGGSACYGGGGAQSVIRKTINVTPGTSISVTIGDGGSGSGSYSSISSWPSGTDGGTTSFGSYLSLHGGYAPKHNSSTARVTQWPKAGGNGGTAGMSNYVQWKDDSSQVWGGGQGGSSLFGVGGNGGVFDQASPTSSSYISAGDGIGYGSGGGSSCVQSSGRASAAGDGADGILIVEVI